MAYTLFVNLPDSSPISYELSDGRYRIGSNPECEILIESDEVAKVAAQVEVRGEAIFLRNLSPFPIFVGQHELSTNQQGEWPTGQTVLLTQSVSLDLTNPKVLGEAAAASESAKRSRSTMQLAIVILCIVAAYFLLSSDSTPVDSTQALDYSFTDLVEQLEHDKSKNFGKVLNSMIDARVADVRWGSENPARAVAAYQLLLDQPLIREANAETPTTEGRIRQFALTRLDDLSVLVTKLSRRR